MAAVYEHIPPARGVTEIRVHGVGGTPPEALLGQTGVQQVAGDDTAGFFRGAIADPSRSVEAYSWGGLTAQNRSRALWVLLLPFALINLAGWMIEPSQSTSEHAGPGDRSEIGTRAHEALVQLIAMSSTAMYVMWTALITVNTMAFQCGAIADCREGRWYLDFLGSSFFADHPGRRVVIGLLPPIALLLLFTWLGRVSRKRYDDFGRHDDGISVDSVEQTGTAVGSRRFWFTGDWQRASARLHIGSALLILGGLLGRAAGPFERQFGVDVASEAWGSFVFGAALVVALFAAGAIVAATLRTRPLLGDGVDWFTRASWGVLATSIVLMTVAVLLTWRLEAPDAALLDAGANGGPVTDYWGFGWAPLILLSLAIVFVALFSLVQTARWIHWRAIHLDQMIPVGMLVLIVLWESAVPTLVVLTILALIAEARQARVATGQAADPDGRPPALQTWRRWLALGFLGATGLVWVATRSLDPPFGLGWPRLTPLLFFTIVLVGANLAQSRGYLNRAGQPRAAQLVQAGLAGVPAGIILAGWLLATFLGRDEWLYGAAGLGWAAAATAWLAQFGHRRWRWNGPAAVTLMALSILFGAFSGLMIWMVDLLDGDGGDFVLRATAIYEWLTVIFIWTLLALLAGLVAWWPVATLEPTNSLEPGRRTRVAERLALTVRAADVALTVAAMISLSSMVALALHLRATHGTDFLEWINDGPPDSWAGIVSVASWASLGVAVGAVFAIRRGFRDEAFRVRFGILWDVASFWPRSFHPFAPPSYASRAVPELQGRLAEIARGPDGPPDNDAGPGRRSGSAILSGHSQGSVLSLAAVATLDPDIRQRVWLVTHGSPLASLYRRFFPTYFPDALFDHCARIGDGPPIPQGRWLNFYRTTDPIGGPCFAETDRDEVDPTTAPAWSRAAVEASGDAGRALPDIRLQDPPGETPAPYAPPPEVRGHSGYMADPAMRSALDVLADHLDAGTRGRP